MIGVVSDDLVAVDREAAGRDGLGDVAGRHRAVELAGLAGLADHREALAVELFGDLRGLALQLEVAGLELRALRFEPLGVGLRGPQRLAARQQEVAGEAVAHAHALAHLAELGDAFEKNDIHGFQLLKGECGG